MTASQFAALGLRLRCKPSAALSFRAALEAVERWVR